MADLEVFQTVKRGSLQSNNGPAGLCITIMGHTNTPTLRELASTHHTGGTYTRQVFDLHYCLHSFLKLITGLINSEKSWMLSKIQNVVFFFKNTFNINIPII